jgi:hypothetical protein
MKLQDLNPRFGNPFAEPTTMLLERVRQWSERDAVRWLRQFMFYGNAQDLLAELETELDAIEAEIATLEATSAIQSEKAAEAKAEQDKAHRIAYSNPIAAKEKAVALREEEVATRRRNEAEATVGRAHKRIGELRKGTPSMYAFRNMLQAVQPPELGAMSVIGELLAQVQDGDRPGDRPAERRRGRKKRGG